MTGHWNLLGMLIQTVSIFSESATFCSEDHSVTCPKVVRQSENSLSTKEVKTATLSTGSPTEPRSCISEHVREPNTEEIFI